MWKKLVKGIAIADVSLESCNCEHCIVGKMHRQPFPKEASRSTAPLQLAHSDLWGKAPTMSLGKSEYYISFTDDYSRYSHVYTLKKKSDAFAAFISWHVLVERETGRKLKMMRTDNGGEYINNEWHEYFRKHGIKHQTTNPHTPQQNGVAERLNRTIVERTRACLFAAGLPECFWAEAVQYVVYTKNRCPTFALTDKTPYEAFYGKKPDISNL